MIKRTVALLLVFCTLFSVCSITVTGADIYTYTEGSDGVTITSWDKNDAYTVTVPEEIDGEPVVAIGADAFRDCKSIYEIIIPDTVTSIDASAFIGCVSLKSITVSNNNPAYKTQNGNLYTKNLTTLVKFCDVSAESFTVLNDVNVIGDYAFYGMDNLKSVSRSTSISKVGKYAFYGCSSLETFIFSNVKEAGEYSFYGSALKSADVNIANIPEGIFYGCDNMESLVLSKNTARIEKLAFAGCYSLDSVLIPNGTDIADEAFFGIGAVLYGSENVKAYAEKNGNKYAVASYNGNVSVSKIEFEQSKIDIKVDDVVSPKITVEPADAEVKDVILTSSNEDVVKIENGKIKAVANGSAVVFAKSVSGAKITSLNVNVSDRSAPLQSSHPYENGLNKKYSYTVEGNPEKIAVTFSADTYVEDGEDFIIVMDKDNKNVGTYTAGQLAGKTLVVNGDTVNITLISDEDVNYFGFCIVKAESYKNYSFVTDIKLNKEDVSLKYGEEFKLEYTCTPSDPLSDIRFVSGDSSIVSVDSDGTLYAINAGTAFVIVYDTYSGNTAQCRVTVEKNVYNGMLYTVNDGKITITHYEGEDETADIPSDIDGLPVTEIGKGAFMYSPTLKKITIPASVTSIHSSSFAGCVALAEISVSSDNEKFTSKNGALYSRDGKQLICCPAGKAGEFKIPDGVIAISEDAFNMCIGITKITFPKSIELIPASAFLSCESLTAFEISASSNYSVKDGVLYTKDMGALVRYPTAKDGAYVMPDSVQLVKSGAFDGCVAVSEITLSKNLKNIENGALSGVISLEKILCNEENPFFSSHGGVLYNKNKTAIVSCPTGYSGEYNIPAGVKEIGEYAFKNCASLYEVYIPTSVTSVGSYAFCGADGIGTLTLPPKVNTVGDFAFDKCSNIKVFAPDCITSFGATDGGVTVLCPDSGTTKEIALSKGYKTEYITYSSTDSGMALYFGAVPDGAQFTAEKAKEGKTALISSILTEEGINVFTLSFNGYITDTEYTATVFCNPWVENVYKLEDGELEEVSFGINENGVTLSTCGGVYVFSYFDTALDESEIAIKALPDKTEYEYGEQFIKDGLSVYFKNHAGIVSVLEDSAYTFGDVSLNIGGVHNVKVTYGDLSTEFTVTVKTPILTADVRIEGACKFGSDITLFVENVNCDYIPYEITWYRNGELIEGENGTVYSVSGADSGKDISAKITAINGCEGEISSNTLKMDIFEISSDVYSINKELGIISKINEKTTVDTLLSGLSFRENVGVFVNGEKLDDGALVSTGSELCLYSGDVIVQKLTVVVTGDINGDGKISLIDFSNIKAYMLGDKDFTSYDRYAADANGDGKLSLIDFSQFKAHMLGDLTITGKEY